MKSLILIAALLSVSAEAGTVYRDRYLPAGAPCMIPFVGRSVNATMIKEVAIVQVSDLQSVHVFSPNVYSNYRALRLTMINGGWYELTEGNLEHAEAGLLALIADCRK